MAKVLDLTKTVAQLVEEYPEVKDIMAELGFGEITNPMALKLMGKVMTIPKGAAIKGIALEQIVKKLTENGFTVVNGDASGENGEASAADGSAKEQRATTEASVGQQGTADPSAADTPEGRRELLRSMIQRLSDGEPLESVRKDFVAQFSQVSAHEIAAAEQQLINEGVAPQEVQRVCDVHSALFHGKTEAEIFQEEEEQIQKENGGAGHPLDVFYRENRAIDTRLSLILGSVREEKLSEEKIRALAERLADLGKGLKAHYSKKEELVMPILYRYNITGPSQVMWGVDDEISREVRYLAKALRVDPAGYPALRERVQKVAARAQEMIYKEEKILFPLCRENFQKEEWYAVYRDMPEMGFACLDPDKLPKWQEAEDWIAQQKKAAAAAASAALPQGVLHLPTGDLTLSQLYSILDVLPIDLTFIDENDVTRFFTNKGKIFSRPLSCIGRPVYECHPPVIVPVVKSMLQSFREGTQDHVERWIPNPQKPVRVVYHAVHDADGKYIGTLEMVQSFEDVKIPGRG